ncbi:p41 [Cocksfoot mild mosaic virus]|nr:p41 [Cocksfoot mild mosaic virus]ABW74549.1 p41 [Cocksfoot mild mosaic virus]
MEFFSSALTRLDSTKAATLDWSKFHALFHLCPRAAYAWLKIQLGSSILGDLVSFLSRAARALCYLPVAVQEIARSLCERYNAASARAGDAFFYSRLFDTARANRWSYLDDSSPPDMGASTVSWVTKVDPLRLPRRALSTVGAGLALYGGYRTLKFLWNMWKFQRRQDAIHSAKTRTQFLEKEYQEVRACMEEMGRAALRTRMEDCILKDVITPEEKDEEGNVVQKEVSQMIIKLYGKFVRQLVALAKVEFNGVPKNTEANQLAVWRFMYRCCEKRGLNALDANRALSSALPLVFLPSTYDHNMAITMTCEDTVQTLQRYRDAFAQKSSLHRLLDNPLSGQAWKEWANTILYGDQATGLHFAK